MSVNIRQVEVFAEQTFPDFGVNKRREIIRLLYEIAKREGCAVETILHEDLRRTRSFRAVKSYLLKRRYPGTTPGERGGHHRFLKVTAPCAAALPESDVRDLSPEIISVEEELLDHPFVMRMRQTFRDAEFRGMASYRDEIRRRAVFGEQDYNERNSHFFIVKERFQFWLDCPCSAKSVPCGYTILNLGQGCPFNCSYCFLQGYVNSPGLVFPVNTDDFFKALEEHGGPWRIGTGQFTDSLALDHLTRYSLGIIDFMRKRPDWVFEFKTKSDNIDRLLTVEAPANVFVGWSLNPEEFVRENEKGTVSLARRIKAARACARQGYKLTFHFDPIVFFRGWEEEYKRVIDLLFDKIAPDRIAWISLGCLRMTPRLKQAVETRFPDSSILDGILVPGFDGKLRYPRSRRMEIYRLMLHWIREKAERVPVYLCMEEPDLWMIPGLEKNLNKYILSQDYE